MAKIGKNELSRAKKKAEMTAQALGEDLNEQLYKFYTEYSENNYEKILENAVAARQKTSQQQNQHRN